MAGKDMELDISSFKYVDAYYQNPQTGDRTKWIRLEFDKLDDFRKQYSNYNVFCTIQRYRNKTKQTGGETQYAPLYFDLDSDRKILATDKEMGLVELGALKASELTGLLPDEFLCEIANFEIGLDMDKDNYAKINACMEDNPDLKSLVWRKNIEMAQSDALKIIGFFSKHFGTTEDEVRVYFSGSKGFHVLVNPVVLGIKPDKNLHRMFKFAALWLESLLDLHCLDSGSIYGHGRQLRLVDSVHYKSGLWKIELTHERLRGTIESIKETATAPQGDLYPPDQTEYSLNESANDWFIKKCQEWADAEKTKMDKCLPKSEVLSGMDSLPACVQFVLDRGILKSGDRNKATMALASYYKDIGSSEGEAVSVLTEWVKKIPSALTSSGASEARASTITCIKTVYQDDKYHFQCAFIRSLHSDRQGKSYEAIACGGRDCAAHEDYIIGSEPAEFMHLSKTANAEYTGKKVAFNALVSGKLDTPYIVPKKVRFSCSHESSCDKECSMKDYSGLMEKEFHENERFLIEACNQNDQNLKGIMRHHSRAACNKVYCEVLEYINVSELLVVPMADRVTTVPTAKGSKEKAKEIDNSGNEYVTRKVYGIGNEILDNNYYRIEGYVYSHPKNAMATVLSQSHTPLEDNVSQFKLSQEIVDSFKVFQKASGETIDNRLDVIINDIVNNVTRVYQRFEPHLAILMTYHSCLNYYFQDQLEKRGWLETILVGDSSTAKTLMTANLMEFIGVGNMASGEGSSRTGLIYRLEQMGERWFLTWGRYPLSDRKLLAIDEFGELPIEDFGKITEARTTGVLKVDRAKNAETNARVRLLLLTNPTGGHKTLSEYTHGIESLKSLFASPADIRRLDLAIMLQSGDVPKSILNKEYVAPEVQLISAEVLRNSVLWAWSRKAEDIEITKESMRAILKSSDMLSEKYGYAQDIPILEPGDLRKKLARLSISLAMLVHSTDETHEHVIVLPEHVAEVVEFLELIYDNRNSRLDLYAQKAREESELSDSERALICKKLNDIDFGDNAAVSDEILELFRKNEILKPNEVIEMLGFERGQVIARLAILTQHNMITRTKNGLRKLPKFIEYLDFDEE